MRGRICTERLSDRIIPRIPTTAPSRIAAFIRDFSVFSNVSEVLQENTPSISSRQILTGHKNLAKLEFAALLFVEIDIPIIIMLALADFEILRVIW